MNSKNENASNEPNEVVDKQKQTVQESSNLERTVWVSHSPKPYQQANILRSPQLGVSVRIPVRLTNADYLRLRHFGAQFRRPIQVNPTGPRNQGPGFRTFIQPRPQLIDLSALINENEKLKRDMSDIKAELNGLKNVVHGLVQKQQENGPNKENQNSRKNDNFGTAFKFESPPEPKKIKLDPDENQDLKNKILELTKQNEDLKKKLELCVCHGPVVQPK